MTKHIVRLSNADMSLLLRELNHRISNDLTYAICTISARDARQSMTQRRMLLSAPIHY
jgi:hypothetical protein